VDVILYYKFQQQQEKYSINGANYSPRELNEQIEILINSKNYLLNNNILDAINNYIPQNALPFVLRADNKYNLPIDSCEVITRLQNTLSNNSSCEIERKCLTDYLDLLKNAICDREYRFVKRSDYYFRIVLLAKEAVKNIIATYLYESYEHSNAELDKFRNMYFKTQAKLV
jgi:hypothetical protein